MTSLLNTRQHERGNMLFMILIAVVLIGLLSAAIMSSSNSENSNIDKETLVIRASEAQRQASEFERAVMFITSSGTSESDLRFAHQAADPDYGDITDEPKRQIFHKDGGGATYAKPPEGVNDGSNWEFFAGTAIPGVGSNRADLVAVLPNVTQQFCDKVNELSGQPVTPTPEDTGGSAAAGASAGDCVAMDDPGRFSDTNQFYNTPNTMDETTFAQDVNTSAARTALQACVKCDIGPELHFYHVLLAR